ncbi:MAG: helix-turn-helix domain-containing protein [Pseudomonadota bacterium]
MESLGQFLRRERELREITITQVSNKTKISPYYIKSIETDNYERFPGDTFVKGFLRLYASSIGLNSDEILNRYLEEFKIKETVELVEKVARTSQKNNHKMASKYYIWGGAIIIACLAASLLLFIKFYL